ncbi:MAG: phosphoribosylformylglycinamidine synthase II [Deltaproteobacteria bacterium]|nr:MAG: phosphoribosylformylglycinamidine synthase II [Deltaproteobacteria bacterium]
MGNVILYVGARTGRDGLHGATMASRGFAGATEGARPAVQVGDPFAGKRLIEATLAVVEAGLVAGMQDLGAAGLASALFEMANRSGTGITVDLARVPLRQRGLSPTEILLSESQERMVIAADPAAVPRIAEHFQRWDLCCVPIGEVTPGVSVAVRFGGARVLELPASFVGEDAPRLDRPRRAPPAPPPSRRSLPAIPLDDPAGTLLAFLATPQLAARNVIYEQFDHGVQLRAIDGGGSPAPLLRLPETGERIAVVLHVPPLLPTISPRTLGRMAVLGAALRLACRGARPLGLTDGLNFGSPEDPHVMWRFAEVVSGIAEACERFEIPVTGGNVSFYNETRGVAIPPTPVVGMIGGVRGEAPACVFREPGEILLLIGRPQPGYCWAYQTFRGMEHPSSPDPPLDLGQERRRLAAILSLSRHLRSLRLVTAGGLARAIVAAALDAPEPIGVRVDPPPGLERATFLFSEWPPTLLATTTQGAYHEVAALLRSAGIPCHPIGRVGGDRISIGGAIDLPIDRVERVWRGALERILQERKD